METSGRRVSPRELKAMIRKGGELAILDVREEGVFARGHLFYAVPLPLSRLELRLDALVPRRATPVVLIDDGSRASDGSADADRRSSGTPKGDGLAQRAASKMRGFGYTDIAVLDGGNEGWRQAGYELFGGVHVPSKAFGEFVEHELETPRLEPAEIKAKQDSGADLVILDSRPLDEFRRVSIPGGIDCPGAELVHRAPDLVRSPETLVVVNCAGRTRSIIGAQSLINAGVLPNRIVALKNGTMGWHLAGLATAHGETKTAPPPSAEGLERAREAARRVAERSGVRRIDGATIARFRADASRTTYVLDVRSPEEYAKGHLPFARSAPGGQLVQATDTYVGTRNARLVLVDSESVRAPMTASWLRQMGWDEVYAIEQNEAGEALVAGPELPSVLGLEAAATIGVAELKAALDRGEAVVVDLGSSHAYREAHIPGAWFAIRSRFAASLGALPPAKLLVLASPDGVLARLAASEAEATTGRAVRVLEGGTSAWRAAGLPMTDQDLRWADEPEDAWYKPYDRGGGGEKAMKEYLDWEVDLVAQVRRDGDARFRILSMR